MAIGVGGEAHDMVSLGGSWKTALCPFIEKEDSKTLWTSDVKCRQSLVVSKLVWARQWVERLARNGHQ